MTDRSVTRYVVGYDYSPLAEVALERACELATGEELAEVHVVTVVMLGGQPNSGVSGVPVQPTVSMESAQKNLQEEAERIMNEWSQWTGLPRVPLVAHVRSEAPAQEIARLSEELAARMVIVGTHGRKGLHRLFLGSVAEGVVRNAPCEVLVVRSPN